MNVPKVCLNMIVKNESNIIVRLLESVLPLIDGYCICDTGSTDNTIELIRNYFNTHNIPGKIMEEPFQDFGYNRSYALKGCHGLDYADYILLLDADMKLEINTTDIESFKRSLTKDAYYVIQGSPNFHNHNIRLLRNDESYHYWGVTHEYIALPDNAKIDSIDDTVLFINDIGDGGCKENKYHRDIELLKKGLIAAPNNPRYTFYLANSYKDSMQYELAIDMYKKRINIVGWVQEAWYSYYAIGNCYMYLGEHANAIYYWLEAYQYMPTRIENLYKIVMHYRIEKKYALALMFYNIADRVRTHNPPTNHLFLENDVYEHKLDYEYSIVGYYTNINKTSMRMMCIDLLNKRNIQPLIYANILSNYKYYCTDLFSSMIEYDKMTPLYQSLLNSLNNIGTNIMKDEVHMYPSTPSVCAHPHMPNELFICKRYVNYTIDKNGEYVNGKTIITKNVFATLTCKNNQWTLVNECMMDYNKEYDNVYIGNEDVKLYHNGNSIEYTANRVTSGYNFQVEYGKYDHQTNTTWSSILEMSSRNLYEKNWTLFTNQEGERRVVYKWSPLTICELQNNLVRVIRELPMPHIFKELRGSSNGVTIGNEIWFLCHLVSYEHRRYYYHMFVVINNANYQLIRYSNLFTFNKCQVEYTLGFVYMKEDNKFLIGYSSNDNTTNYMLINKDAIDNLFVTRH